MVIRLKQVINYLLIILLWVILLVLLVTGFFPYIFWLLVFVHFVETITIGWRTGKAAQLSGKTIFILCMIFGCCWWRPIRQRIREEDFGNNDFREI